MAPLGSRVTGDRRRRTTDPTPAPADHVRMAKRQTAAVLVVDDDPDARGIYSGYLRMKGFVVFTGADGRAAIISLRWRGHVGQPQHRDDLQPQRFGVHRLGEIRVAPGGQRHLLRQRHG